MQVQRTDGLWYSAEYSTFSITDEASNYRLTVAWYSGDAGDAMAGAVLMNYIANRMMFSSLDRDNDILTDGSCAAAKGGGWWHADCSTSVLNDDANGHWDTEYPSPIDVQSSRMLVKAN